MNEEKPNFQELEKFWNLIKPKEKDEYLEIRFTDKNKSREFYNAVDMFSSAYPDIIIKNKVQFFIKKFEELRDLLQYNNYYFFDNFKICYGISLRNTKNGEIGGSYEYVENARFVFFDIDKKDHSNIMEFERQELRIFIDDVILPQLSKYGLTDYTEVDSGGGTHLLFKIPKTKITDAKKLWYKEFVKSFCARLSFIQDFEIDGIYDFTRVFALPETMNVKREVKTHSKKISYTCNDQFKFRIAKKKKIQASKNVLYKYPNIDNSLEWNILKQGAPKGERHQILIFALKLLAKSLGLTKADMRKYEEILEDVYDGDIDLDPQYGTEGEKQYNPFAAINWCRRNQEWCKANKINYLDYAKHMKKDINV